MAEVLSASAKKRLAKKARDEKAAEEAAPAATPAPKAAAAKAAAGSAKAKPAAAPAVAPTAAKTEAAPAKAKAKAQAATCAACGNPWAADSRFCNKCGAKRPDDAAPAAAPKAAAKADPKKAAAPAAAVAPAAAAPKSEGKKAAKAAKAAAAAPVAAAPKVENLMSFAFEDDGTGGWEASDAQSKKKDKQKEKKDKKDEAPQTQAPQTKAAAPAAKSASAPKDKKPEVVSTSGMTKNQMMIAAIEAEATEKAQKALAQKALEQAAKGRGKGKGKDGEEGEEKVEVNPNFISAQVTVPSEKMGRIIGPQGKTLAMITEKTGVDRIDTLGDICTIIGDPEPVKKCEVAIKEMVEKGYMSMAYENFAEESVMVHPDNFPALIGQKGAIIRKIKEELNVEINIPAASKDANGKWGKKKFPVSVAGSGDGVQTAKEVINDIVYFRHHKITHPDIVHADMEVEETYYRFIIGPKGSEMRHIQNSFKVDVNIPREGHQDTGACPNLLIVGMPDGVESAKAHIEKLIHNADNMKPAAREDKPIDDERNKGDDEVDAEAAKYLIKKK